MDKINIMVVDDENNILFALKRLLKDYNVSCFTLASAAIESLNSGHRYDILVVDYQLQALTGLDILIEAQRRLVNFKSILLTAHADKELIEQFMNNKWADYVLDKPYESKELKSIIEKSINEIREKEKEYRLYELLKAELNEHRHSTKIVMRESNLIFKSKVMALVVCETIKIAKSTAPVLIKGESGVGKDLIASLIHEKSQRSKMPFLKINCATIPETLFESELFGSKKGSYTGSVKDSCGKFLSANKGTLFLDEISEIPFPQQSKLLRIIENKELYQIGSETPIKIDVRIICASNRDLNEMISKGYFRKDLYHRLNVLSIDVPSLKERKDDIYPLSIHLLEKIALEESGPSKYLEKDAINYLENIDIPGNVRDLRNILYKSYYNSTDNVIKVTNVKNSIINSKMRKSDIFERTMPFVDFKKFVETEYISKQLELNNFSLSITADSLSIQKSNLSRKIKQLGISISKHKRSKKRK